MKLYSTAVVVSLLTAPFGQIFAADDCCASAPPAVDSAPAEVPTAPAGHPLKGVIVDVLADKSSMLVKHEEIPGVMKAMTMLLKVDADALKSPAAKKGTEITGLLVRKTDGWWLEGIAAVPAK